jgi:hypothetical protein
MARVAEPRHVDERIADFLQHVSARQTVQSRQMPFVESEDLDVSSRHPPKSRSVIRRILLHIRTLVRGATQ